jgi:hypothetical protein
VAVSGPSTGQTGSGNGQPSAQGNVPPPAPVDEPPGFFNEVLGAVAHNIRTTVQPDVVAAVATTFSFPLILAIAVVAFLLLQARLDSRDPKIRFAPRSAGEVYIAFEEDEG